MVHRPSIEGSRKEREALFQGPRARGRGRQGVARPLMPAVRRLPRRRHSVECATRPPAGGVIQTDGQERGWLSRSSSKYASAWGDPNVSVKPKALRLGQPPSICCV